MKIYLKNLVCQGTKIIVIIELERLGLKYSRFKGNEIEFEIDLSLSQINQLEDAMRKYNLELTFQLSNLVLKVREDIGYMIENDIRWETGFSNYIAERTGYNYVYLNACFRKETGFPIEEYYIETIYEKMRTNDINLSELYKPLEKSA